MTAIESVVFALCTGLCFAAFACKLRDCRRRGCDPARMALLIGFAFKGFAFLLASPSVAAGVDRELGIPNLAALGIHLFGGVVFNAGILLALVFWYRPSDEARAKAWLVVGVSVLVSAAMVLLWLAADIPTRATHYLAQDGTHLFTSIYLVLYVTVSLTGLGLIARLCSRQIRDVTNVWLRRGLRAVMTGSLIYIPSFLDRLATFVVIPLGLNPLRWELLVPVCTGTGMALIVIGFTMPTWGPMWTAACRWVQDYRAYRELFPLWRTLCDSVPEIALEATGAPGRTLQYRLYRRIIEIRDGQLALLPYMDSSVADDAANRAQAAGLDSDDEAVVVEAARLKAAVRAKAADFPIQSTSDYESAAVRGGDDVSSEIAWLLRVARAYQCSPVVQAIESAPVHA
jgi:hypothetical protein